MRSRRSSGRRRARSACARTSPPRTCRCCRRCRRPVTRDTIVCSAADFPSMIYLFRAQEALGYRLVIVPANDDGSADPGAHRRGHRRPHGAGRRLARAVPLVVHPRPRADRRAGQARRRAGGARPVSGGRASSPSTSPRSAWTLPPAGASSGCAAGPATRFSTRAPIGSAPSGRASRAGRHTRSRSPSTSRTTSRPPTIGACRRGRRRSRPTTPRCPGSGCWRPSASTRCARRRSS